MTWGIRNDVGGSKCALNVILRWPSPYCHSEERTTKNLRCPDTRWIIVGTDQGLVAAPKIPHCVRNDIGGFGMTVVGFAMTWGVRNDVGGSKCPLNVILRWPSPYCHSEERTTKNLRCPDRGWIIGGTDQGLVAAPKIPHCVRNDIGGVGMTVVGFAMTAVGFAMTAVGFAMTVVGFAMTVVGFAMTWGVRNAPSMSF